MSRFRVIAAVLVLLSRLAPSAVSAVDEEGTAIIPLAPDAHVSAVAVSTDSVWVANGRSGTISRIDPRTNQMVHSFRIAEPSPTCQRCSGAVAARGDTVWASMNTAGPVIVHIDPSSTAIAEAIEVGVRPAAIDIGADGAIWLTATLEGLVVHVDPRVVGAVSRIPVSSPSGIVADTDAVWATTRTPGARGQVVRIDPHTDEVIATIGVGRGPGALAVGDGGVWVANEADHTVSRIDPRTNTVVATIPVVHFPVGLAIGDDMVWVASRGSALLSLPSISRISTSANTVVEISTLNDLTPIGMAAGLSNLWIASSNPDEVVRLGPVALPTDSPTNAGEPWLQRACGVASTILLLAACAQRRGPGTCAAGDNWQVAVNCGVCCSPGQRLA